MWPNFLHKNYLSAYLSASHVAIGNSMNNLIENHDDPTILPSSESMPTWQQSCRRLESLLEANKIKSNVPVTVLLGSDLVRFLVLPPQQVMMNVQEKTAYAAATFQEIYGENANDWQLKYHDNVPNKPFIVAAIDKNLLNVIYQTVSKHQFKLTSIQPYVMAAFNESAKHFVKTNTYLAIVEMNRLTLILIQFGYYQQLRSHVISGEWQADLTKILLRESAISETDCRDIIVYSPMHKAKSLTIEGWTIKSMGQFKPSPLLGANHSNLKVAI